MSTTTTVRKKLIEVALPLEAINKASAREKSIRHGHPSTLHLWWARRPLAACRAVLFGQLVDDPSAWPDKFKGEEAQEAERQRLFRIIEKLVLWENSTNEDVLNAARWEIARSVAWGLGEKPPKQGDGKAIVAYLQEKAPPVYDPFCGGGSIPLEAQRLGLRAHGSDLNPVAVLISKALVEIPPKFAGMPPVNPEAREKLTGSGNWNGKGAQGLAEDVRYYGKWMQKEAQSQIGYLYPQVEVTEEAIRQQPSIASLRGQRLPVLAWLWARTVNSPNPAAAGRHVPLVNSYHIVARPNKDIIIRPIVDPAKGSIHFEIDSSPTESMKKEASTGTKSGRGEFRCQLTGSPISAQYLRSEGKAGRLQRTMLCVIAAGPQGKVYLPPQDATDVSPKYSEFLSDISCPQISGYFNPPIYGYSTIGSLFLPRQRSAVETFARLVAEARQRCVQDGANKAYADAITLYLTLGVSRMTNRFSSFSIWDTGRETIQQMFSEQGVPMAWDFAEVNPFSGGSGSWAGSLEWVPLVIERSNRTTGSITLAPAQSAQIGRDMLISTDPPYYSSITYADFADYFYGVMRSALRTIFPELLKTAATPKQGEAVAAWHRFDGDKVKAGDYFTAELSASLKNAFRQATGAYPIAIYYAFKAQEISGDAGKLITAWESILSILIEQGLLIESTFPLRTEQTSGRKAAKNSLASSIVIVGRRRPSSAGTTTRAAFLTALKRELPEALKLLQAGNIAPVDLAQASIGPGMSIFSRHSMVLEADDSSMSVKTALQLINQALDDYLSEQESEYDTQTRFAITWFETHGMDSSAYGEAETLAKARNVAVSGVADAGLLESKGGKVRLLKRSELDPKWDPLSEKTLTVWECAQHLIRVLEAEGETAAAALLIKLGSRADATRDLAYRLYQICERKKWADEARAYNGLVVAWPELQKLASQQASTVPPAPAQATLI